MSKVRSPEIIRRTCEQFLESAQAVVDMLNVQTARVEAAEKEKARMQTALEAVEEMGFKVQAALQPSPDPPEVMIDPAVDIKAETPQVPPPLPPDVRP